MMTKEHIVDTYREIRYTMGNGCSGGIHPAAHRRIHLPRTARRRAALLHVSGFGDHRKVVSDRVPLVNYFNSTTFANLTAGLTRAQMTPRGRHRRAPRSLRLLGLEQHLRRQQQARPVRPQPGHQHHRPRRSAGAPRNNCQLLASQVYDPIANLLGPRWGSWDGLHLHLGRVPGSRQSGSIPRRQPRASSTGSRPGLPDHLRGGVVVLNAEDRRLRRRHQPVARPQRRRCGSAAHRLHDRHRLRRPAGAPHDRLLACCVVHSSTCCCGADALAWCMLARSRPPRRVGRGVGPGRCSGGHGFFFFFGGGG